MEEKGELEYRRGRLLLPRDIADWPPARVGRWLSAVPVGERARAFRALPLNVAAAGFLAMEPRYRVGLLVGLNPANIRYLCGIARDEHLLETLLLAGDDVRRAIMESLPDWRRSHIAYHLKESEHTESKAIRSGKTKTLSGARRSWIRRLLASLRSARDANPG